MITFFRIILITILSLVAGLLHNISTQAHKTVTQIDTSKTQVERVLDELKGVSERAPDLLTKGGTRAKVARVVDGDTIILTTHQKVRFIGIDTPELHPRGGWHPSRGNECFAREARDALRALIQDKDITLVRDVNDTDKYGRLLRYVYIGDIFVNKYMVENGYALARSFPPDIHQQDVLRTAEKDAKLHKRGMWADNACSGTH